MTFELKSDAQSPPLPTMPKAIYSIGGHDIHAQAAGASDRQVALLLHGWSSSSFALSPLFPLFDRFQCIAVDLPGYGASPALPQRVTIPLYADLMATLIRQQTNKPAVLVGHSMGGMISLTLALRHPELVERLILLCPTISGRLSVWIRGAIKPLTLLEGSMLGNSLTATVEPHVYDLTDRVMWPVSFAADTGISRDRYLKLRGDARRPGQGRVRLECYVAMQQNDLGQAEQLRRLDELKLPALAIWGMEDKTVPLRDAGIVDKDYPSASLHVLPRAGHWPQFETPEKTLKLVRGFLNRPLKMLKLDL